MKKNGMMTMTAANKSDIVVIYKIRANLLSLANYYTDIDFMKANQQPRYHRKDGPVKFKHYKMSSNTKEAVHYWQLAESSVWSEDEEKKIKRFYNAKRKSGELEKAIVWERPRFNVAPTSVNLWRAQLHKSRACKTDT